MGSARDTTSEYERIEKEIVRAIHTHFPALDKARLRSIVHRAIFRSRVEILRGRVDQALARSKSLRKSIERELKPKPKGKRGRP